MSSSVRFLKTDRCSLAEQIMQWYTVKLGFNELGYNEHSVITNEYFGPKSQFST